MRKPITGLATAAARPVLYVNRHETQVRCTDFDPVAAKASGRVGFEINVFRCGAWLPVGRATFSIARGALRMTAAWRVDPVDLATRTALRDGLRAAWAAPACLQCGAEGPHCGTDDKLHDGAQFTCRRTKAPRRCSRSTPVRGAQSRC